MYFRVKNMLLFIVYKKVTLMR